MDTSDAVALIANIRGANSQHILHRLGKSS
jgi:hypothetical protein